MAFTLPIPPDTAIIIDDEGLVGAALVDTASGTVIGYVDNAADFLTQAESGIAMFDGTICGPQNSGGVGNGLVEIYDATLTIVASVTVGTPGDSYPVGVTTDGSRFFYVIAADGSNDLSLYKLSKSGSVLDTWSLGITSNDDPVACTVLRDNSALFLDNGSGGVDRFDLVAPGLTTVSAVNLIGLVCDGSGNFYATIVADNDLHKYDSGWNPVGSVAGGPAGYSTNFIHLSSDGAHVFVWTQKSSGSAHPDKLSALRKIRLSDLSVISDVTDIPTESNSGFITPGSEISNSCPLMISGTPPDFTRKCVIWPVWLNADENGLETFLVFAGRYLENGTPLRYDFDGNLVRDYPYDPTDFPNGMVGMTAVIDSDACLQKFQDDGVAPEDRQSRGMIWLAGHRTSGITVPGILPIRLDTAEVLATVVAIPAPTEVDKTAGFTVLGSAAYPNGNGDPTDQGLPPKPSVSCGPITNLRTPAPNPGCNEGGRGFIPSYTGPSGTWPIGTDPVGEETFTGKTEIHAWAEIQHTRYESDGTNTTEVLRYGHLDLDDTIRKEGRLIAAGTIEQASSDGQGNMKSTSAVITIFDEPDRPISTRRGDPERKNFNRDELTVYARSMDGRRNDVTPRMLGRLLLNKDSFGSARAASLNAVDQLHHETGSFSPDKTLPQFRYPLTHYVNAPADLAGYFMPVIVGEVSDNGAKDPTTGLPNERGKCTPRFVGIYNGRGLFLNNLFAAYSIDGLYGSDCGGLGCFGVGAVSDEKSPSTIALLGSGNFSLIPQGGWAQLVLFTANGRSEHRITDVKIATRSVKVEGQLKDLQPDPLTGYISWFVEHISHAPRRVKIDIAARQRVDVMVPGYTGFDKATPYTDFSCEEGDYRVTEFEVWGPLLAEHLSGGPTLATNTIGVEDKGDSSGLPITDYFTGLRFLWDVCIHEQRSKPWIDIGGGTLGWPQSASDLPQWSDTLTKTMGSSYVACQAQLAASLGGDGPKINAYFDQGIGLRDGVQLMNDDIGCWQVVEEHGRVKAFLVDPFADTSAWPHIVETERIYGNVETLRAVDEAMNWIRGGCDWDPDGGKFREDNMRAVSQPAIRRNKGYIKYSKHLDGKLIADPVVFQDVLDRKLWIHADGPIYVPMDGFDFGAVDLPIGSGFMFTSKAGPGTDGYVEQPLIQLDRVTDLDGKMVGLLCLDVGTDTLVIPEGQRFIATDDDDLAPIASDDDAVAPVAVP